MLKGNNGVKLQVGNKIRNKISKYLDIKKNYLKSTCGENKYS